MAVGGCGRVESLTRAKRALKEVILGDVEARGTADGRAECRLEQRLATGELESCEAVTMITAVEGTGDAVHMAGGRQDEVTRTHEAGT